MSLAHFKTTTAANGKEKSCTVTIDRARDMVIVRERGSPRTACLRLSKVADIIIHRHAKALAGR